MTERLGFRMAALLSMALLPVGIVAVAQSFQVLNEVRARSEAALMGETLRAVGAEAALIQRADGGAEALAAVVPALMPDNAACTAAMKEFVTRSGVFSFAGFIPVDGMMQCSSSGKPYDFSKGENFIRLLADPKASMRVNRKGAISGQSVLTATHPVLDGQNRLSGFVSVSLPHSALTARQASASRPEPIALFTFDAHGEVLTSSIGLDATDGLLPADRMLESFVGSEPVAYSGQSRNGVQRVFSVVPLVPDKLYALGTWPSERVGVTLMDAAPAVLFPGLMWLVSLTVAWLATERLVTRHIRKLRASITTFARGSRRIGEMAVGSAPLEIRQVAEAYDRMTDTILHDEAELEDMVHQKEVLLREVHHRVKNNLQLIASIMNMQMRQTQSSEARVLMKGLQDRVMSLATIHRGLYQTTGLIDVHANELLSDIVRQVVNLATGPGRQFDVRTSFADMRLTPDQAVPLALLLTEALTNAMKYAGSSQGERPWLEVVLDRPTPASAELTVANALGEAGEANNADTTESSGLGSQLVTAFAQQLGGTIDRTITTDAYRLKLTFAISPLTEAEARHAAASDDDPADRPMVEPGQDDTGHN